MPIALASLIDATREDQSLLPQILETFCCEKDPDISEFLQNNAVQFELLGKSRTFLICDADQIHQEGFCLDQLVIYGYVALALKVLSVPQTLSVRRRKELDGLSGKYHNIPIDSFPCYLIGQLARNSDVPAESLSGDVLLQTAYDYILTAVKAVGGRYILIECKEEEKLILFYTQNGFEEFNRTSDGKINLVQMLKKI